MTTPNPTPPSLVAPIISTQGSTLAALALAGKAVASVANNQLQIMGATVTSSPLNLVARGPQVVTFVLDTDTSTPLTGHVLDGRSPQLGARIMVLLYPPRGYIVLGEISDSALSTQVYSNAFGSSADLQLYFNDVAGGDLNLMPLGGQLILGDTIANQEFSAPALSWQSVRDTAGHTSLSSTSFVAIGTTAIINFIWPESGCAMVHHKTRVTNLTGGSAPQVWQADVIVKNITAGTTPYAGSTNNGFNYTAPAVGTLNFDICGWNLIGSAGSGGIGTVGTPGDLMSVQVCYAITSGLWNVGDISLAVGPSV